MTPRNSAYRHEGFERTCYHHIHCGSLVLHLKYGKRWLHWNVCTCLPNYAALSQKTDVSRHREYIKSLMYLTSEFNLVRPNVSVHIGLSSKKFYSARGLYIAHFYGSLNKQ
jgi:hypothetical protein